MCSPVESMFVFINRGCPQEKWFSALSPVKTVIGVSWHPRTGSLSSLYDCLLCLPLCHARCRSFQSDLAKWLPNWERASHSALLLLFMYFLSHLESMLGL